MPQKEIFLKSEGDKYFLRNKARYANSDFSKDNVINLIKSIITKKKRKFKILDIGCGDGGKLDYLTKNFSNVEAFGIDPSGKAIKNNKNKKVKLKVSTADDIPFNFEFDIVVLGFCLYLCDDEDLFKIASEVFRVSKKSSYIIIEDFIREKVSYKNYKHRKNIKTRKMNYTKIFNWHPKIKLKKKVDYIFSKDGNKNNLISSVLLKKEI